MAHSGSLSSTDTGLGRPQARAAQEGLGDGPEGCILDLMYLHRWSFDTVCFCRPGQVWVHSHVLEPQPSLLYSRALSLYLPHHCHDGQQQLYPHPVCSLVPSSQSSNGFCHRVSVSEHLLEGLTLKTSSSATAGMNTLRNCFPRLKVTSLGSTVTACHTAAPADQHKAPLRTKVQG